MPFVLGLDGCRGGWVRCKLYRSGGIEFDVFGQFVLAVDPGAALCLVDIPIGLTDRGVREADVAARRVLGRRHVCVFSAPVREVIACGGYEEATGVSAALSGRRLTKQAWGIVPKIREVDGAVRSDKRVRQIVRECHPEVCLWGLAGSAMAQRKKSSEGAAARLGVLRPYLPDADAAVETALKAFPKGAVGRDDVIDALICAVSAAGVWDDSLHTLPQSPDQDRFGLAMEMVYRVTV